MNDLFLTCANCFSLTNSNAIKFPKSFALLNLLFVLGIKKINGLFQYFKINYLKNLNKK